MSDTERRGIVRGGHVRKRFQWSFGLKRLGGNDEFIEGTILSRQSVA